MFPNLKKCSSTNEVNITPRSAYWFLQEGPHYHILQLLTSWPYVVASRVFLTSPPLLLQLKYSIELWGSLYTWTASSVRTSSFPRLGHSEQNPFQRVNGNWRSCYNQTTYTPRDQPHTPCTPAWEHFSTLVPSRRVEVLTFSRAHPSFLRF